MKIPIDSNSLVQVDLLRYWVTSTTGSSVLAGQLYFVEIVSLYMRYAGPFSGGLFTKYKFSFSS